LRPRGSLGIFEVPKPLGSHARNDASNVQKTIPSHLQPHYARRQLRYIKLGALFTAPKKSGTLLKFLPVTAFSYPTPGGIRSFGQGPVLRSSDEPDRRSPSSSQASAAHSLAGLPSTSLRSSNNSAQYICFEKYGPTLSHADSPQQRRSVSLIRSVFHAAPAEDL